MKRNKAVWLLVLLIGAASAASGASAQIYDDHANARQLIEAAIRQASSAHKNIVLDFGANWCLDCHVLDARMRQGELAQIVRNNFVVVHVSVGRYDRNMDLAAKYGIPIHKGIPSLAVLNSRGKILYSQKEGQFENARDMDPSSFLAFFKQWAPKR